MYCHNRHRNRRGFSSERGPTEPGSSGISCRSVHRSVLPGTFQAHSRLHFHQRMTCHPQIGQRKQGGNQRSILGQSFVAILHQVKLTLDHPKRMLHLGANTCLELLRLVQHLSHGAPVCLSALRLPCCMATCQVTLGLP